MRRHVILYGVLGGLLVAVLRYVEYRWLVVEHSLEIYGGIVATVFAAAGVWVGLRITRMPASPSSEPMSPGTLFVRDEAKVAALGLTPRELVMLELIAAGLSTKEIAAREFVSENTVKTHLSRVFGKLGARRRTQAVELAKRHRLIAGCRKCRQPAQNHTFG